MTIDRTELEWTYEPADFFEAPYNYDAVPDFELKIEDGTALATLTVLTDMPAITILVRRSAIGNIDRAA